MLSFSEQGCKEYSASIVRIGELTPVEGSDFLAKTVVDGEDIIVRKDEVSPGDLMVYCRIETSLNSDFLSSNNLYEWSERERNQGYNPEDTEEEARKKVGFFNKHGRVKMIKLRGCPSKGFLFKKEGLVKWKPKLADINLEDYIDKVPYFDTIDGELFIKVYVPQIKGRSSGRRGGKEKKALGFNTLIPGQFQLHYDTVNIGKEIHTFRPNERVSVTVKLHGTSMCIGNILIKKPCTQTTMDRLIRKAFKKKLEKLLKSKKQDQKLIDKVKSRIKPSWKPGYGVIYSSRKVIKNEYINPNQPDSYYSVDVWGDYYKLLKGVIPKDTEIFGEIIGYETDTNKFIQKGYDYGCKPGENKLMIYRITIKNQETGKTRELDVPEVLEFTKDLIRKNPELKDKIHPIDILYVGSLHDLYPDIPLTNDWANEVLKALKSDFGMEGKEPLCREKVPREGIVIRRLGDPVAEAYKLKSNEFLLREGKMIDKGEVDYETLEGYGDN